MKHLPALTLTFVLAAALVGGCAGKDYEKSREYQPRPYPFEVKYTDINDIRICYTDDGTGDKALILVHGLSGSIYNWKNNVGRFSPDYRVITIDLPGHGNSERRNDIDYGIPLYAETIKGLMDHLGIEKAVVAGVSMGGHTVCYFAWKYPQRTRAAVLIDAAGLDTNFPFFARYMAENHTKLVARAITRSSREMAKRNQKNFIERSTQQDGKHGGTFPMFWDASKPTAQDWIEFNSAYMNKFVWTKEYPKYNWALVESAAGILSTPMTDKLGEIRAPTLIVWGEHDGMVDIENAYRFAKGIPDAFLVIIEDSGHVPPVEEPEQFNNALARFLKSLPDEPRHCQQPCPHRSKVE